MLSNLRLHERHTLWCVAAIPAAGRQWSSPDVLLVSAGATDSQTQRTLTQDPPLMLDTVSESSASLLVAVAAAVVASAVGCAAPSDGREEPNTSPLVAFGSTYTWHLHAVPLASHTSAKCRKDGVVQLPIAQSNSTHCMNNCAVVLHGASITWQGKPVHG